VLEFRVIGLLAEAKNGPKRRPATEPIRSPNPVAPREPFGTRRAPFEADYKINQNKDLFIVFRLAETALKQLK
jgi:hypothetical protein